MMQVSSTPMNKIDNAHQDDIHGLIPWKDGFISGSKDNTIGMWNKDGQLVKRIKPGNPNAKGYEYWVTALTPFSNGYWASGTRDGGIDIWDRNGKLMRSITYSPSHNSRNSYYCKNRNKARINCITESCSNNETTMFFTGTPKFIQEWDAEKKKLIHYSKADANDWVYCIEKLEGDRLAVVYGSTMQVWESLKGGKRSTLIQESQAPPSENRQREHISAIQRLENLPHLLSAAVFDGSVRLVDLISEATYKTYHEHEGRVWSVINLEKNILASCADDASIKIWDIRGDKSVQTIGGNPGRVSTLLRLNPSKIISGSCPNDVRKGGPKAEIAFWDLRKIG